MGKRASRKTKNQVVSAVKAGSGGGEGGGGLPLPQLTALNFSSDCVEHPGCLGTAPGSECECECECCFLAGDPSKYPLNPAPCASSVLLQVYTELSVAPEGNPHVSTEQCRGTRSLYSGNKLFVSSEPYAVCSTAWPPLPSSFSHPSI